MGAPMAKRLLNAGYDLAVWNRSKAKTVSLEKAGARVSDTPGQTVAGADIVMLCLTDSVAVQAVVFGNNGVLEGISSDAVVIDFSTIGPERAKFFADKVHRTRGVLWIDAPVSGGVAGADSGELIVFASGDIGIVDGVRKTLSVLAQKVTYVGDVGAGQATKLCNQLIVASTLVAISEAINLGRVLGVQLEKLPDALTGGFADSPPLQIFGRRMASNIVEPKIGEIGVMRKDVLAICEVAEANEIILPLLQTVAGFYQKAADAGIAGEDISALMKLYK